MHQRIGRKKKTGDGIMITIEKTEVYGWEAAIRGLRNPMNSWGKSDSTFGETPHLGENDLALMRKLYKAGSDHRKYLRYINVTADITAPLYWWKEYDTYKVGTVANSCSTMHKIHAKEFTLDDFSHEHLIDIYGDVKSFLYGEINEPYSPKDVLEFTISALNANRIAFLETKNKKYWWQMIQLLPSSYNQKRTVMLNYEVLVNQYLARKDHKLDEWHTYCAWIETLPYWKEICNADQ